MTNTKISTNWCSINIACKEITVRMTHPPNYDICIAFFLIPPSLPLVDPHRCNQSTTVAAIIGLAVSGWIGVGTTLNKVRDPVLPGPVHNCSILDPGAATTMSSLNNSFTELVSTGIGNFDVSNGYNITNLTSLPDMER